jgi:CBS domain containing-hemolysin-like protein
MYLINLLMVIVLIIATAFFVAAEFAIVKIRPSRVDQLMLEGRKNALSVRKVLNNLDGYLSACQLGITITALGLGWLGEPTLERILHPVFEQFHLPHGITGILSFGIAFIFITYLHVVFGELAPKSLAIQKSEAVSLLLARPLIFFYRIMYPFIWLLNGSANRFVKIFGLRPVKEHEDAHSEEEIRIILNDSYESGKINKTEYGYVSRIFAFDELLAREIMVPRTDMVCLYADKSREQNLRIIKEEQYTRFPVVRENKDQIVGMVNTKQFFLQCDDNADLDFSQIVQPVLSVPETMPIKKLLKKMQEQRTHIAILVDEYGGTSGMITIEDILEEIVGEIRDEFDAEEKMEIEKVGENHFMVDGKVSITHINNLLNVDIEHNEVDSIGGWLYGQNPELKKGMEWKYGDLSFVIREKEKHRIRKIEIRKHGG